MKRPSLNTTIMCGVGVVYLTSHWIAETLGNFIVDLFL